MAAYAHVVPPYLYYAREIRKSLPCEIFILSLLADYLCHFFSVELAPPKSRGITIVARFRRTVLSDVFERF